MLPAPWKRWRGFKPSYGHVLSIEFLNLIVRLSYHISCELVLIRVHCQRNVAPEVVE